ncbi:hypothetical protein PAECIP111893_00077 [Paenibacillus plantiphilus]|uniref:Copper amine oxidase-like N-terminal domain-containing protein n=1 Tax=Paenibacillus plantiphilus TaxID=2905650 RepID=A0ABM9BLJ1_9BACL|nr:stalk domain-containing protein [Paenibacillus plantiphilus]CAH1189993.1 hypothetical protein PAECIP111893_00077 [Paenibacillus plantiphilus]
MRKLSMLFVLVAAFFVGTTSAYAAEPLFKVYVDGHLAASNALVKNGSTIVPFRSILAKLNFYIEYDARAKIVKASKDSTEIIFTVGSKRAVLNGKSVPLTAAPEVINNSTYIPLRFVSESMNYNIEFDQPTKAIYIDSKETTSSEYSPLVTPAPAPEPAPKPVETAPVNTAPTSTELSTKAITELNDSKVVIVNTDTSQGSAVSLGEGVFITNYHVIEDAKAVSITDIDGNTHDIAGYISLDEKRDLALIKTKKRITMGSVAIGTPGDLKKGDKVVAIGSPLGQQNTVSQGVISNIGVIDGVNTLQISVPIDHGSSGGGLFDTQGKLVGITSSGIDSSIADLNFAVSISEARSMISSIAGKSHGDIPTTAFSPAATATKPATPNNGGSGGSSSAKEAATLITEGLNKGVTFIPTDEADIPLETWVGGVPTGRVFIMSQMLGENYLTYLEGWPNNKSDVKIWATALGETVSEHFPGHDVVMVVYYEGFFKTYPDGFKPSEITTVNGGYEVTHFIVTIMIEDGVVTTIVG